MSCRVIDGKTDDTSSSESNELSDFASALSESKDLTDEDIEKIKKGLEDELTAAQMNELIRILQKFKKGTTPKDHFEGMVSELMLVLFFFGSERECVTHLAWPQKEMYNVLWIMLVSQFKFEHFFYAKTQFLR